MKERNVKIRREKGITLIALVITIIVLLILAGVSIAMLTGENGILTQAQKAKNRTEEAKKNEMSDLRSMESLINEYTKNIDIPQVTDENPGELEQENETTFVINSIEDLVFFAYDVTTNGTTYEGKTVKLGTNLDFNSDKSYVNPNRTDFDKYGYNEPLKQSLITGTGFSPIGELLSNGTNYFYGTFNGDNKAICSLYMNIDRDENIKVGLFSICYGEIKNLGLVDTNITIQGVETDVGGITGASYDNIYNSYVTGNINVTGSSWMSVAGLCGRMLEEVSIENCYNLANIECKNILEGYGNADISCGGILGQRYANINKCYNKGNITIDGGDNDVLIGGICGSLRKGGLKNSYNNGEINVNSTNVDSTTVNVAGICADVAKEAKVNVENCYNSGQIIGKGEDYLVIGGIVAYQRNDTEIKNTFNAGNIKGETPNKYLNIGGILGMDDGTSISNGYNTGVLQGTSNAMNIGGIVGTKFSENTILNCEYLAGTCDVGVGYGTSTGVTEVDTIDKSILEVVNGEGAFKEDNEGINNGYPILEWQ